MANSRTTFTAAGVESTSDGEEIENALHEKEGIQLVTVDDETGEVVVRHGEALISAEEIEQTVEGLGYDVED